MSRRVEQALAEVDKFLVGHLLHQGIDGHGRDELSVTDRGAILQQHHVILGIDPLHASRLSESRLLLGQCVGDGDPDASRSTVGGETKGGIGAPVTCRPLKDDVLRHRLQIGSGHSLAEPLTLHLPSREHGCRLIPTLRFLLGS